MVRRDRYRRGGMGEGLLRRAPGLVRHIAERVGTPVYIYDAHEIRRRYAELARAFEGIPHRICYSVKANSNRAVLATLEALGAGADIVSAGELARAVRAGFAPRAIVFSGVGKSPAELAAALEHGVGLVNVESAGELEALEAAAVRLGSVARFGIRVNPEVTAETHPYTQTAGKGIKFGIPVDDVLPLIARHKDNPALRLCSLGMHIGSQICDPRHFERGVEVLGRLVEGVRNRGVDTLESVDVGGGLGIRYTDEIELSAMRFAEAVRPLWESTGLSVLLEPGRFLVGPAGMLVTRCLYRKHSGGKDLAVVDAGMNDLIRPSLYGAAHEIRLVTCADGAPPNPGVGAETDVADRIDIVGPLCETGDFLGRDIRLPGVEPGSILAILATGAYGFSMSSTYNSRPRPAEVLVEDGRWAVIRMRERVEDLMDGEAIAPEWRCFPER